MRGKTEKHEVLQLIPEKGAAVLRWKIVVKPEDKRTGTPFLWRLGKADIKDPVFQKS